jgi:DNA-binding CsgD family transcriptional regulator
MGMTWRWPGVVQSGLTQVLMSRNRTEFRRGALAFTKALGFDTFSATLVIDHVPGEAEYITVSSVARARSKAASDRKRGRLDTMLQRSKRSAAPIVWGPSTSARGRSKSKPSSPESSGHASGICVALHLSDGQHFLLDVERRAQLPLGPNELTRVVADLQLFAVHAQNAALRILLPASADPQVAMLTPREVEVMQWTMKGKTATEAADLLGISERTATLHLDNATHKLKCINIHQALLKALQLGILD